MGVSMSRVSVAISTPSDIDSSVVSLLECGASFIATDDPASVAQWADARFDSAGVVVATSGSTGRPKGVVLAADAIRAAAANFRQRYGAFTWTCALPPQHVAGLMVCARGYLDRAYGGLGTCHISPKLDHDLVPSHDAAQAISLVPTQISRLAQDNRLDELARFDLVLVGGAALSDDLRQRLQDASVPMIESYGMSETCGGAVFDGQPLPGVVVRVDDDERVWLSGDMLFSGYLGDPDLTEKTLVDGWLRTNDRGSLRGGTLTVSGRVDDVVISGGLNVDLAVVQRVVSAHSPTAIVVSAPDDEWGARVVLADRIPASLDSWRARLRAQLPAYALPRQVLYLSDIPLTAAGKTDRQAIIARAVAEH